MLRNCSTLQQGHPCLSELIAVKCSCRAKTALVTNVELTPQQLSSIDQSGFGAHCLQGVTKNLGLPIHGSVQLNSSGSFEPVDTPDAFLTRCSKQLDKLRQRLKKIPSSAHSIRVRIIFLTPTVSVCSIMLNPFIVFPKKICSRCTWQWLTLFCTADGFRPPFSLGSCDGLKLALFWILT